ncbi:hypothetical protein Tco_1049848 [Tanacetum coccineum]
MSSSRLAIHVIVKALALNNYKALRRFIWIDTRGYEGPVPGIGVLERYLSSLSYAQVEEIPLLPKYFHVTFSSLIMVSEEDHVTREVVLCAWHQQRLLLRLRSMRFRIVLHLTRRLSEILWKVKIILESPWKNLEKKLIEGVRRCMKARKVMELLEAPEASMKEC